MPAIPQRPGRKKNKNNSDRGLRYPLKQMENDTDYLQIDIKQYTPVTFETTRNFVTRQPTSTDKLKNVEILKSIFLPIPQNIQDTNAVGWGEDSLNSIAAYGVGQVSGLIGSGLQEIPGKLNDSVKGLREFTLDGGARNLSNAFFSSQAVNILGANTSLNGILARSSGQILNPNTELLFNGVKLRSFNFDFDFTPRSADEAIIVKKIIKEFKVNMAANASKTSDGLFLSSPNVFQLTYKTGIEKHQFLHSFKPMALVNMSVNYTGSGTYATYSDTTPVHMKMQLSFQELNPIYAEDYNDSDANLGVGY